MSKHKRFHGMWTPAKQVKAYAFFHAGHPYGSIQRKPKPVPLDKKTAHAAANNVDGRAEQTLTRPDSASMITQSQGGLQDEMDR